MQHVPENHTFTTTVIFYVLEILGSSDKEMG